MIPRNILLCILLIGCVSQWRAPTDFMPYVISAGKYSIFTYQKTSDSESPVHIYIEGDGNAFDGAGQPTSNPTPYGTLMREIATSDTGANVVYMARPCQYVMSDTCRQADWTTGRFSSDIIDSMSIAIRQVAKNRPVVLIGYSGGALITGLVILQNSDLNIQKWITIAGVLNHSDWTEYFNDAPLELSLNMNGLPHVNQVHYIASHDATVPQSLSYKWLSGQRIEQVPNSSHSKFPNIKLDLSIDKR